MEGKKRKLTLKEMTLDEFKNIAGYDPSIRQSVSVPQYHQNNEICIRQSIAASYCGR